MIRRDRILMKPESVEKYCKEEIEVWRNPSKPRLFPLCVVCDFKCGYCPIHQLETSNRGTPTNCIDIPLINGSKKTLSDYDCPRKNASKAMRKAIIEYLEKFPARWKEFYERKMKDRRS